MGRRCGREPRRKRGARARSLVRSRAESMPANTVKGRSPEFAAQQVGLRRACRNDRAGRGVGRRSARRRRGQRAPAARARAAHRWDSSRARRRSGRRRIRSRQARDRSGVGEQTRRRRLTVPHRRSSSGSRRRKSASSEATTSRRELPRRCRGRAVRDVPERPRRRPSERRPRVELFQPYVEASPKRWI